jgi:hypothetical protein
MERKSKMRMMLGEVMQAAANSVSQLLGEVSSSVI